MQYAYWGTVCWQVEGVARVEERLEACKAEAAALRKAATARAAAGAKVRTLRDTAQSGLEVLQGRRKDVLDAAAIAQVC